MSNFEERYVPPTEPIIHTPAADAVAAWLANKNKALEHCIVSLNELRLAIDSITALGNDSATARWIYQYRLLTMQQDNLEMTRLPRNLMLAAQEEETKERDDRLRRIARDNYLGEFSTKQSDSSSDAISMALPAQNHNEGARRATAMARYADLHYPGAEDFDKSINN